MYKNYGELKSSLQKYLDRSDSATISMIPEFIYLAEKQIQKELFGAMPEIPSLENEVQIELYPHSDYVDMPADMGRIKLIYDAVNKNPLEGTTYTELLQMKDNGEKLTHYARHINRLYFRPFIPTVEYPMDEQGYIDYDTATVRIVYVRDPVVFKNDTDTSYFLTTCPEVLLYGALSYGYDFVRDAEKRVAAEQKMMASLAGYLRQLQAEDLPDIKVISYPQTMYPFC